uniref:Uncharacterized protein n=1 Tax=Equus asinus TaxID=9793 RepID=A0A8C4LBG8_EQUAS
MKEKRIRASWASPLQLPGFLIDGDYYIIDLLDRTVPALGTLSPSSKPAPQPGTSRTEPAAQLCRRPPAPPPLPGRETSGPSSLVALGPCPGMGRAPGCEPGWRPAGLRVGLRSMASAAPLHDCGTHLAPPT